MLSLSSLKHSFILKYFSKSYSLLAKHKNKIIRYIMRCLNLWLFPLFDMCLIYFEIDAFNPARTSKDFNAAYKYVTKQMEDTAMGWTRGNVSLRKLGKYRKDEKIWKFESTSVPHPKSKYGNHPNFYRQIT